MFAHGYFAGGFFPPVYYPPAGTSPGPVRPTWGTFPNWWPDRKRDRPEPDREVDRDALARLARENRIKRRQADALAAAVVEWSAERDATRATIAQLEAAIAEEFARRSWAWGERQRKALAALRSAQMAVEIQRAEMRRRNENAVRALMLMTLH